MGRRLAKVNPSTIVRPRLGLSDEELAQRIASESQTVFANRVAWAIQYLKQAKVIEAVRRGVYRITPRGAALLNSGPARITAKMLLQFPEFAEFVERESAVEVPSALETPVDETVATPEETLEKSFQTLRDALVRELLETIKNGTPAAQRWCFRHSYVYAEAAGPGLLR